MEYFIWEIWIWYTYIYIIYLSTVYSCESDIWAFATIVKNMLKMWPNCSAFIRYSIELFNTQLLLKNEDVRANKMKNVWNDSRNGFIAKWFIRIEFFTLKFSILFDNKYIILLFDNIDFAWWIIYWKSDWIFYIHSNDDFVA